MTRRSRHRSKKFTSVSKLLQDAEALIAKGDFHKAVDRIGHALAAAQAAMHMQDQRNDAALDVSVEVKRIADANSFLYEPTNKALPESMDVVQFYQQNKPFDTTK